MVIIPEFLARNLIEDELRRLGIDKSKTYVALKEEVGGELIGFNDYSWLPYLEFHVLDRCNLNCKRCAVFSPLVKEDGVYELDVFKKDISRLKELVCSIDRIRIMGGEPFLNSRISKYVEYTRNMYPYSELIIVTNGTLLDRVDVDTWRALEINAAKVQISSYPALYNKIDVYVDICKTNGVDVEVVPITDFKPVLREKQDFPFNNTRMCQCNNLRDGKVSSCAISMYGYYYNDFFDKNLPFDSGVIDIFDQELNGKALIRKLNTPYDICDYCQQYLWTINDSEYEINLWNYYTTSAPKESDWLY